MGAALSNAPAVRLVDSYGNRVEKAGVTVTALNSDRALEISNNSVTTDASGIATFGRMTFGGTIGSYRLSFAPSGGVALQAAADTSISAGAASRAEVQRQLDGLASGLRATTQPTLRIVDRWGNAVAESGWTANVTLLPISGNTSVFALLQVTGNTVTSGSSGEINFVDVVVAGMSGVTYRPTYRVRKGLTELGFVQGAVVALAPGEASQFTYEIATKDDSFVAVASGAPIGRIRQSDAKGNPVNAAGARQVVVAYQRGSFPDSGMSWGRQIEPDVTSDGVTTLGYRIYGGSAATGVLSVTVDGQAVKQYNVSLTSAAVVGDPGPSGGLLLRSSPSSPRFDETAPVSAATILSSTRISGYVANLTINGVANWALPTAAHTTQMMNWSNAGRLNLPTNFNRIAMVDSSMTVPLQRYLFWLPGIATKQSLPYGMGYYGVVPVRSFG